MAALLNRHTKVVFSKTLDTLAWTNSRFATADRRGSAGDRAGLAGLAYPAGRRDRRGRPGQRATRAPPTRQGQTDGDENSSAGVWGPIGR